MAAADPVSSPLIIALDYPTAELALAMAAQLDPALCRVKVGKELFTRAGPAVIERLHRLGFQVFLDLKFHDIPNTVAGACRAAAELGVWMVNVHALGGRRMLLAAREAMGSAAVPPLLIAVTVLTSLEQEDLAEVGIEHPVPSLVERLARLAHACALDGVVCSALEAPVLRISVGRQFLLVTPGIRPRPDPSDDQRRVMGPREALRAGSHYLVVGRPVTAAADPAAALRALARECLAEPQHLR